MTPVEAVNPLDSANSMDFEMPAPGTPGYDEFRKTGKLPSVKEDSAPSEKEVAIPTLEPEPEPEPEPEVIPSLEEEDSAPSPESAVTRAESAPALPQKGKGDANARIRQLVASQNKDRELIRQLTEKLTGTASVQPQSRTAVEPEAKPEAKAKPKIGDLDAQGKPVFKTYGEYEDARDEWNRGELMRLVEEKNTKTQQSAKAAEAEKVIAQNFGAKVVEARKKHADFDTVALNPQLPITKGSVADQFIVESDHGPEVLYSLGSNPAELDRILALNPIAQARELFKIEQGLTAAPIIPAPVHPKPPARTVSQAPPPPHQVSGKGPTPDLLEKVVKDGDQTEFVRLENDKAIAKFTSRRR